MDKGKSEPVKVMTVFPEIDPEEGENEVTEAREQLLDGLAHLDVGTQLCESGHHEQVEETVWH